MALAGVRVVEFGGLAPVPFAGMILADYGATVIRIDRPQSQDMPAADFLARGKRSIALDVRTPEGLATAKDLISKADVLLDPYRPGVLEKLGLGPEVFLGGAGGGGRNERLVYARLAGFEPTGPNREFAGHDINYLAASGVLSILPKLADGTPSFPLNIVSDFAGGSHACVQGVLLALIERGRSGVGQVVSADMVSGARYVSSFILAPSQMADESTLYINGKSLLGGDAPFYSVYACKGSSGFISVGCLEPKFFKSFLGILQAHLPDGFDGGGGYVPTERGQMDLDRWEEMRRYFEAAFKTRTRDDWARIFDAKDACVFPVLTPAEAAARRNEDVPAPHPNLDRTPANPPVGGFATLQPGLHSREILSEIGYSREKVAQLLEAGIVRAVNTGSKL
ncbi:CoA-transferase family III [Exidia glandulosa HHB12029]|uniref:CoA-transferase family III n=1 Tax=Exidia glandulosa HHB12029 TaxID=1314781 RepID=A0A165CHQ3_EXIGL|nr:CoA-transferase family III [Exidia glandulosa HHB12029]